MICQMCHEEPIDATTGGVYCQACERWVTTMLTCRRCGVDRGVVNGYGICPPCWQAMQLDAWLRDGPTSGWVTH
jgi:hypothetical protein